MKAKTINKVLTQVHDEWLDSITDKTVRALARKGTIITGGCITSMLIKQPVNDYDIYFTDKATVLAVTRYYVDQFQNLNSSSDMGHRTSNDPADSRYKIEILDENDRVKLRIKNKDFRPASEEGFRFGDETGDFDTETHLEDTSKIELPKFRPVYLSANAITLSDKIQLVMRFYGDPDTIHENYDFNHCKCYWTPEKLVLPQEALEAIVTRELVYTGSRYPLASIIRTRKFINRGWTINAGQYLKMCLQLNELDLTDLETLEDQLIGMDAAYFAQILAAIPKDKVIDGKIDSHYIMAIIDRFF